MKFTELNLADELISGLNDIQFIETTPIQEKAIPHVLEGKDIIGTAQTGTGKTGAFVIPILQRILSGKRNGIKAVILTPTRELAQQIDEQIFAIGYHTGISSATVIGGSDFSTQAKALKAGVDIIVATPGRFMDQNKVVNIDLSGVEYLILDEADRMLDMGFLPDMKKIIEWLPKKRQTLLFSATMPKEIEKLASSIMENPVSMEIARSKPAESVEQRAYFMRSNQKIQVVKQIFDSIQWDSCIIFTSTKKGTDELQRLLKKKGIKVGSIHGDRSQDERNKALNAFKSGESPVIVATNVIARGIDIKDVSMIINYDVPRSSDDYVHRIGRTGRYDKSGIAVTLVTRRDSKSFEDIDRIKGNKIKKIHLPESFDESSRFDWETVDFKDGKQSSGDPADRKKEEGKQEKKTRGTDSKARSKRETKGSATTSKDQSTSNGRTDRNKKSDSGKREEQKTTRGGKAKETSLSPSASSKRTTPEKESKQTESSTVKTVGAEQPDRRKTTAGRSISARTLPKVEKAVERNKYARRPAKGVWGIIKSVIPTFKRN